MEEIMNKRLRILIADDNVVLCEIIKQYLERNMDIDILGTVYDGEEEIKLIKSLKPDIVITDLQRKRGISGIDVIRKCYNEFEMKKIKFIVETASYSKEELNILIDLGIEHLLIKPFPLSQLMNKII